MAEFGEIAVQEAINGLVFGPRTLLRHSVNRDFLTDNLTGVFLDTDLLTLVIYKPFETLRRTALAISFAAVTRAFRVWGYLSFTHSYCNESPASSDVDDAFGRSDRY